MEVPELTYQNVEYFWVQGLLHSQFIVDALQQEAYSKPIDPGSTLNVKNKCFGMPLVEKGTRITHCTMQNSGISSLDIGPYSLLPELLFLDLRQNGFQSVSVKCYSDSLFRYPPPSHTTVL
jgi:hypothetical protein